MGILSEGGLLGSNPDQNNGGYGGILGGAGSVAAGGYGGRGSQGTVSGGSYSSGGSQGGYAGSQGGGFGNQGAGYQGTNSGGYHGGGTVGGGNQGQGYQGSPAQTGGYGGQFGGGGIGGSGGGIGPTGAIGAAPGGMGLGGPGNVDPATAFAVNHILNQPQQIRSPSANSLGPTVYGGGFGTPGMGSYAPSVPMSPAEQDLMARMMVAESGSIRNPDGTINPDGLQAIAEVARNRVLSSRYPNTVGGVLTQAHQFSPTKQQLASVSPTSDAYKEASGIAGAVMSGELPSLPQVGNSLNFGNLHTIASKAGYSSRASRGAFASMKPVGTIADARNPNTISHTFGTIGAPSDVAFNQPVSPTPQGVQFAGPGVPQPQPAIDMTRAQPIPTPMEMGGPGSAFINPASSTPEQPGLSSPNVPSVHEVQPSGGGLLGGLYNDYIAPKVAEARNAINYGFQHPTLTRMAAALSGYGGPAYQSPDVGGLNPPNDRPRTVAEAIRKARKKKPSDILNWNVIYRPNPVA